MHFATGTRNSGSSPDPGTTMSGLRPEQEYFLSLASMMIERNPPVTLSQYIEIATHPDLCKQIAELDAKLEIVTSRIAKVNTMASPYTYSHRRSLIKRRITIRTGDQSWIARKKTTLKKLLKINSALRRDRSVCEIADIARTMETATPQDLSEVRRLFIRRFH